mgnify:CR=1 FL=1
MKGDAPFDSSDIQYDAVGNLAIWRGVDAVHEKRPAHEWPEQIHRRLEPREYLRGRTKIPDVSRIPSGANLQPVEPQRPMMRPPDPVPAPPLGRSAR